MTTALPKMADAASSQELRSAFLAHLEQTKGHACRLEQIFKRLGMEPKRETCEAMKGLFREGSEIIDAKGNAAVMDAALIAAAQRVEHYEIAGYGTVRTLLRLTVLPVATRRPCHRAVDRLRSVSPRAFALLSYAERRMLSHIFLQRIKRFFEIREENISILTLKMDQSG